MTTATTNTTIRLTETFEASGVLEFDTKAGTLTLWTDEGPEYIETNLLAYGYIPEPGHVYIKDWEHTGLAARMQEQGLVRIADTVNVGPYGGQAHLVEVTI